MKHLSELPTLEGAEFGGREKEHQVKYWKVWDETKPAVLFIGLNPTTGEGGQYLLNTLTNISRRMGYGGFFLGHLFCYISLNYKEFREWYNFVNALSRQKWQEKNLKALEEMAQYTGEEHIVFGWGSYGQDYIQEIKVLQKRFPRAKCVGVTENLNPASPVRHPKTQIFLPYEENPEKYVRSGR